ncbi:MAG TPA: surface-adhesin E family protein [Gemmatimonadaceae bacterium]|nr:surface-adhesin E family protein [Gemmatimonadaceae bacterium]
MRRFVRFVVLAIALGLPATAAAQQWKPIGRTTRDGSEMFVKASSIRRGGDTVTALILTRFATPTWNPVTKDSLRALTTLVTFDCGREKVVVKESVYYVDFDRNRVSERRKPKVPGYQAVFGAAYPIAYASLCAKPK